MSVEITPLNWSAFTGKSAPRTRWHIRRTPTLVFTPDSLANKGINRWNVGRNSQPASREHLQDFFRRFRESGGLNPLIGQRVRGTSEENHPFKLAGL